MRLHDLLAGLDVVEIVPRAPDGGGVEVTSITNDSRRVAPGGCYACIPGARVDGHAFAGDAVAAGAVALLVERVLDGSDVRGIAQAHVPEVRAALGPAAANLFGHPSRALRCVGITGTNGKTTTTFLLESIARAGGVVPGVIGTVGARVGGVPFASAQVTPTTPEACDLQLLLAAMRDAGVDVVAMEVSSHGLARREVDGTEFAAVCFTNLGHDHLDYHHTLDDYFEAKARLFDGSFARVAAVNVDDARGRELAGRAASAHERLLTFGLAPDASVTASGVAYDRSGTTFTLVDRDGAASVPVHLPLVGPFNVSNALAAASVSLGVGFDATTVAAGLEGTDPVPGRAEPIDRGQDFAVVVDYAHTPDALAGLLDAARSLAGGGRVVAVFGAGGDRDRAKRPLMGAAVGRAADVAVLTSDNPRSEDAAAIAAEVRPGLDRGTARVVVELDRRAAIRAALHEARPGDVVVVAGKGHETGQTVGAVTTPFDDRVVVAEELEALGVELTASDIARITGGTVVRGPADARATSFAIDSRVLEPGACFAALVAARDGHDFVDDAFARGATVALVAHEVPAREPSAAVVLVPDPLRALGALGAAARAMLEGTPVIGITGSAGKTGTKDLLQGALGGPPGVHASPGSWNNEAGVPLTLLAVLPGAHAVVLEMGARAQGDIAALCAIARPTVGVITNIGLAHAGTLGGPEGVARAKGELFEALPADGLGVLDLHDTASDGLAARTAARVLRVSATGAADADVRAVGTSVDELLRPRFTIESPWGVHEVELAVHGEHVVVNALLAAAVALDAGVAPDAVATGLASARPAPWRMDVARGPSGVVVVNDAYNANPASMAAALRSLAAIPAAGRRIAILGDMRELGDHSVDEHARIGDLAARLRIDALVAVGEETAPLADAARAAGLTIVTTVEDAAAALAAVTGGAAPTAPTAGDVVLVKGSRAVGLEAVALALLGGCDHEGTAR